MPMKKTHLARLKQLRRAIEQNEQYSQDRWYWDGQSAFNGHAPSCGSPACLAGTGAVLFGMLTPRRMAQMAEEIYRNPFFQEGHALAVAKHLGLTALEASVLFDGNPDDNWPSPWSNQYKALEDLKNADLRNDNDDYVDISTIAFRYATKGVALDLLDALIEAQSYDILHSSDMYGFDTLTPSK